MAPPGIHGESQRTRRMEWQSMVVDRRRTPRRMVRDAVSYQSSVAAQRRAVDVQSRDRRWPNAPKVVGGQSGRCHGASYLEVTYNTLELVNWFVLRAVSRVTIATVMFSHSGEFSYCIRRCPLLPCNPF